MGRKLTVLTGTILGVLLMVASAPGQWSAGGADQSYLLETPSGGFDPNQPPVYYPYWHNYLDNMQREGGYYSVTGNYAGSAPVTSYYPASPSSDATSPQTTQSNMYYNPSEYQPVQGSQPYAAPPIQQPAYQTPAGTMPQQVGTAQPQATSSKKKRRLKAKQEVAEQGYYQQTPQYYQQQQHTTTTKLLSAESLSVSRIQMLSNRLISNRVTRSRDIRNRPANTRDNMQVISSNPPLCSHNRQQTSPGLNQDPVVRDAQQKAYERAVARQRAAELASQQQAAVQELQQAQQMLETAQNKFRDQETKQKQLQEEYQKKAIAEAYETLRGAQQRYYDLMGVSGESGRPGTARQGYPVQAARGPQQMQYPQAAPVQGQSYPQSAPVAQYPAQPMAQQPQYQYGAGQAPVGMPAGQFSPSPPGQATPLMAQQQPQQEEGGGFWSTLKEIFLPPTTSPNRAADGQQEGSGPVRRIGFSAKTNRIRKKSGFRSEAGFFYSIGLTANTMNSYSHVR